VPVVAAADGVVVGTRNDMNNVFVGNIGVDALDGKDAGNGVRWDHGNGGFTQYSHCAGDINLVRLYRNFKDLLSSKPSHRSEQELDGPIAGRDTGALDRDRRAGRSRDFAGRQQPDRADERREAS